MVALILGLIFSTFVVARDDCQPSTEVSNAELANTLCLFEKPFVIGASVSAGYGTRTGGPATILSRDLNPGTQITNRAISGATSMASTGFFPRERPSIVLGFDMFFWDAARGNCDENFETQTREFFRRYQARGIPMVIGRIPVNAPFPAGVRLAGRAPCTPRINALLAEVCTLDKNCLLYDPNECLRAMRTPISPSGQNYFLDPIHPTTEGNRFCAEQFIARARYKSLACRVR